MNIRFLTAQDVVAYRDLRLHALRESPTAFASSYEQEVGWSVADFAARLRPHNDPANGVWGVFDGGDRLLGMLGFSRENRPKRSHIGTLWSMYVLPECRGQGLGAALLDEALAHARQLKDLSQVILCVTATHVAASSLYRSRGFERFGLERNALCIDGSFFDTEHLVLFFDRDNS